MTATQELEQILKQKEKILDKLVINFFADLQTQAPVDTGNFKNSWIIERFGDRWEIRNNSDYASILWNGRRFVAGRWFGSEQWQEGGEPMLERLNRDIQRELDRI